MKPYSISWWLKQKEVALSRALGAYAGNDYTKGLYYIRYINLSDWIANRIMTKYGE